MIQSLPLSRVPVFGLVCLTLFISACGKDNSGSAGTDVQADLENVEATAREHADDTPEPSPATEPAPRREVVAERLPYAEVENELIYGHFVFPADMIEPLPAIIVIHEWWGLNDNVRAMANRLAGEGYIVLAVDLYTGLVAEDRERARELMLSVVESPKLAHENIRQAYEFLNSAIVGAPRIGSLGWCFGGGWSLNTAMLFPEDLDATVIYYGRVTNDEDQLRPINAPILGHFGSEDASITTKSVHDFEQALQRLRKDYEIHIYPGAGHAFANPTGTNYNAEAANEAWERTVKFLGRKLLLEDAS